VRSHSREERLLSSSFTFVYSPESTFQRGSNRTDFLWNLILRTFTKKLSKPNLVKIEPKYSTFCMQTYVMIIVTGDSKKELSMKALSSSEMLSGC